MAFPAFPQARFARPTGSLRQSGEDLKPKIEALA